MDPPSAPAWLLVAAALAAGAMLGWLLRARVLRGRVLRGRPAPPGGSAPPAAPADGGEAVAALRRELAAERARAADFAAIASDWWWEMDADLRFSFISGRFEQAFGIGTPALLGKRRDELRRTDYDDPKWAAHLATLAAREPFRDFETTFVDGKGEVRYVVVSGRPLFDDAGVFTGYRGASIDITPIKRLQLEALRRAEVLEAILENLDEGVILFDKDLRIMAYNQKILAFLGAPAKGLRIGIGFEEGLRTLAAAGAYVGEDPEEAVQRRLALSRKIEPMSLERTTDQGRVVLIETVPMSGGGLIMKYSDVTEARKREAGIRQAQKMEALGQLTGGIAHDFNNLLTVILGTADLLADSAAAASAAGTDPAAAERRRQAAATIQRAAERGADLTRRLLAFARQQPLDPHRVNCNLLIEGMGAILAQTLGEHIEMKVSAAPDLWPAEIDAPLLETSLLNLAINARDAMPKGGRLSITTENFTVDADCALMVPPPPPGDYVVIAVSDSGAGMSAEVRARAFDPFFTTKSVGKGSGLGLSMVYGFVRQSGGFVTLYSEPGHGTVVRLYFPRAAAGEAPATSSSAATPLAPASGTILVVEDDPLVRGHVEMMLKGLGYRTVVAENGPAAIDLLRQGQTVDLVFTDMVMPGGMSGRDLVEAARAIRPGLRALVTSGYTDDAIFADDRGKADLEFIAKPYRRADLAERLRQILA